MNGNEDHERLQDLNTACIHKIDASSSLVFICSARQMSAREQGKDFSADRSNLEGKRRLITLLLLIL